MTVIQQILLQKRDGRFYLVIWQGVLSSNIASNDGGIGNVEPARRPITLSLGMSVTSAASDEPSFSANPTQTYANAAGIASIPLSGSGSLW